MNGNKINKEPILADAIKAADSLSESLERLLKTEQQFCADIYLHLERMNWEIYKQANQLKEINQYMGGF